METSKHKNKHKCNFPKSLNIWSAFSISLRILKCLFYSKILCCDRLIFQENTKVTEYFKVDFIVSAEMFAFESLIVFKKTFRKLYGVQEKKNASVISLSGISRNPQKWSLNKSF